MTRQKNNLVMPNFIDQLKKAYKHLKCTVSQYTSKGGNPVVLYQRYQKSASNDERVAALYDYWYWSVFKDFIHNVGYTDSERLV